ncbi:uroporphyrinogen-III C-methyltransferase [Heliophilum fasciatum]|uniref:uroporphyrinogen-III C-methyltransferase n=1 Tax=Heliophilum fasciatum TaxID=35700 RepID=A7UGV1_9FIRM|nr:uroporphyrinogen-III C-methyltransferase [Heliophilum fasciatum]ABU41509.1 HemD [Heliophilum fasciatum]MCW2278469.1 uroporphyrinogen III methyltransferase/synthase [Heliophilum fasciatum]TCP63600.1 uroporphyrinogen-III synthase /uroporphyrinogen-III C-methyltransferase [Heliophilum fasciatum]
MNQKVGKVYLVGAGPGDPGLITVKGLQCIQKADVLVYDRLAGHRLLTYARPDAELIFVGKGPNLHVYKQEEINEVIKQKGLEGKIVTRLKGGDPFVFGRGGEEAEVLLEAGVPFEIVPGITSAISVPAYAGIPVTHRDFTANFAVITGNEDPNKEESNIDWEKISTGIGTLVFLMGMGNLPHITTKLIENGRDPQTPVALIRWGTRPEQRTMTGVIADIAEKAKEANFQNPAIIIVGEVVKLREKLAWLEKKPLFGKRIVVTRSRQQASAFAGRLEELGAEPWEFPTIDIQEPADLKPLDNAIAHIQDYSWIVFTSPNGVEHFFSHYFSAGHDIRDLQGIQLCAIGPQTKKEVQKYGLKVDYVPEEFRQEAIIEGLKNYDWQGKKVLLPRADIARKELPEALVRFGAIVDDVVTYRTVRGSGDAGILKQMMNDKMISAVTFTSSSTARNFVEMLGVEDAAELQRLLEGVTLASIGPVTSETMRALGLRVDVEATEYTIPGLTKALLGFWGIQ